MLQEVNLNMLQEDNLNMFQVDNNMFLDKLNMFPDQHIKLEPLILLVKPTLQEEVVSEEKMFTELPKLEVT